MEIRYDLTNEDVLAFSQHANAQNGVHIADVAGNLMPYAIASLIGIALRWRWDYVWAFAATLGTALWLFLVWLSKLRRMRLLDETPGTQLLRISPEGVVDIDAVSEVRMSWAGVRKIVHTHHHLFIYISRAKAFIIPKRAFANLAEAKRFADQAKEYLEQHRQQRPGAEV